MTSLEKEIRAGYERGWSYTPLRGKRPYLDGWQSAERPSLEQVLAWAEQGNVGVRTGPPSGIAVIDIDKPAVENFKHFPKTPMVMTGSGGFHLYYSTSEPIGNRVGTVGPCIKCGKMPIDNKVCTVQFDTQKKCCSHIDIRGSAGQVVAPGSIHPDTGNEYEWLYGYTPDDVPFAPFPPNDPWFERPKQEPRRRQFVQSGGRQCGKRYAAKILDNAYDKVSKAVEGTRNDTLYRTSFDLGGTIYAGVIDYDATKEVLCVAGELSGLPRYEVERTVERGLKEGMANPKDMDRQMLVANSEFKGF